MVGSGYVGISLSVLLAQHNDVVVLDIDPERVDRINNRQSTVEDTEIDKFLAEKTLSLTATLDKDAAYQDAILSSLPHRQTMTRKPIDLTPVQSMVLWKMR